MVFNVYRDETDHIVRLSDAFVNDIVTEEQESLSAVHYRKPTLDSDLPF